MPSERLPEPPPPPAPDRTGAPAGAPPRAGNAACVTPAAQTAAVTACLPRLDQLLGRMTQGLATRLNDLLNQPCTVQAPPAVVESYAAFIHRLPPRMYIELLGSPAAPTPLACCYETRLLALLIDMLFGGDGRLTHERPHADWTATEQRVVERVSGLLRDEFAAAWATVTDQPVTRQRTTHHPSLLHLVAPEEMVATARVTITLGPHAASVALCLPGDFLKPLRNPFAALGKATSASGSPPWRELLRRHIAALDVQVTYTLGTTTLSLRELLDLRIGDVIPLERPTVPVACVEGVPLLACRHGTRRGRYALLIEAPPAGPAPAAPPDAAPAPTPAPPPPSPAEDKSTPS